MPVFYRGSLDVELYTPSEHDPQQAHSRDEVYLVARSSRAGAAFDDFATWVFFYSADRNEPAHVHVEREANRAKFWLGPVRLARSGGFGAAELQRLERLVIEQEQLFLRMWDEYFTITE